MKSVNDIISYDAYGLRNYVSDVICDDVTNRLMHQVFVIVYSIESYVYWTTQNRIDCLDIK